MTNEIIAIYTCKSCGGESPMTDSENLRWFRKGTPVKCPHCQHKEYGAIELKEVINKERDSRRILYGGTDPTA